MARKVNAEAMQQSLEQSMVPSLDEAARGIRKQPEPEQTKAKGGRPPKYQDGPGGRLSIYIPQTTRDQLEQIAWEDSSKGHLVNLSTVVVRLAEEETARRAKAKARKANQ